MSKHTPGQWQSLPEECDKPYIRIRGTALGGRYKIANVLTPIYDGVHEREAEETRANARLIAAAPDLLAALQEAVDLVTAYPDISRNNFENLMLEFADQSRAAIARATEGK